MTDTHVPTAMIEEMREHFNRTRQAYGYDPVLEPNFPQPLTLEEMKAGELRNALAAVDTVLAKHAGKQDLGPDLWSDIWFDHNPVHDRDLPRFAILTMAANCWTYEGGREIVERAWTLPEWPGQYEREHWLRLFAQTDFICSEREAGKDCPLHDDEYDQQGDGEPITLYRGALKGEQRGLSWTTSRERAEWFARRGDMTGRGRQMYVWEAQVPRESTLAHFTNRMEDEIVADVRGLRVVPVA